MQELKKRPSDDLIKDKFHLFFSGALQNAVIARHGIEIEGAGSLLM